MRNVLIPLAAIVALAACDQASARTEGARPPPRSATGYAVLTELGLSNLQMQPGSNIRHLRNASLHASDHVAYDTASGILTLRRGLFEIHGYSITTFGYKLTPAQDSAMYSAPGYAFLCNTDSAQIQTLGSMQDPLFSLPSHVDDVISVPGEAHFYFGHQNGAPVNGIYLETWEKALGIDHVFARLVITLIGDAQGTTPPYHSTSGYACWPVNQG
jgi:hypothetical protein